MSKEIDFQKMMSRAPRVRLGDYIERSMANNSALQYGVDLIEGVNSNGEFCKPKANTDNINLKPYKIVTNGCFVYNPSRLNIGSFAYRKDEGMCLVSHLYVVFRLNDKGLKVIDPLYLYLYCTRDEFFRIVTYRNFGSQRPEFNFWDMCEIEIPLPSIEVQREIVATYEGLKNIAEENEALLEPLQAACHAYIVDCKVKYPEVPLGEYIEQTDERNAEKGLSVESVRGISNQKEIIPTKADMTGVSLSPYKVLNPKEFCYVTVTSRNGGKISISMNNDEDPYIFSSSYVTFKSSDANKLNPNFLYLLFNRPEFDRYSRFNSWGSARETFDWDEMRRFRIPLPPIEVQEAIVSIYHCMEEAKSIARDARKLMKTICPALIQAGSTGFQPVLRNDPAVKK